VRARRPSPGERGVLHGLSLVLLTLALFGAAAFFALGRFSLRCACADGSRQEGSRNGFQSAEKKCAQLCAGRGGGRPTSKAK
jgi:hypothetical protein